MVAAQHIDTSGQSPLALKRGLLTRDTRTYLVEFIHWRGERVGHVRQYPPKGEAPPFWRWEIDADQATGDARTREGAARIAAFYLARREAERNGGKGARP